MGSNLLIRITLEQSVPGDVLISGLFECITASGFASSEEASSISERARRIGPHGHLPFMLSRNNWHGGVNVLLKFDDYDSVESMRIEPGGRLMAGESTYSEENATCLSALYQLTACIYERCNAREAVALLDDGECAWFRLSKDHSSIPLPGLPVGSP